MLRRAKTSSAVLVRSAENHMAHLLPRRDQVVHTIPHMAQVVTSTAFEQQLL